MRIIVGLTFLALTNAQKPNKKSKNQLRNYDQHRTLSKNEIFGETTCTEPMHRFSDEVPVKLLEHNDALVGTPKQWVCEFCDVNLYMVVLRKCLGNGRNCLKMARNGQN